MDVSFSSNQYRPDEVKTPVSVKQLPSCLPNHILLAAGYSVVLGCDDQDKSGDQCLP